MKIQLLSLKRLICRYQAIGLKGIVGLFTFLPGGNKEIAQCGDNKQGDYNPNSIPQTGNYRGQAFVRDSENREYNKDQKNKGGKKSYLCTDSCSLHNKLR